MPEVIIANSSAIIALQRRGQLATSLKGKTVFITRRIYEELVDKPLKVLSRIKLPELRDKIKRFVSEIISLIERGTIRIPEMDFRSVSKVMDEARLRIAKIEGISPDKVKADHTVIGLAIYFARKGHTVIFLSNDKAINSVVEYFSKREKLKIKVRTIP